MEVLGSGSFVNLESRDKIEQLIFTAKELASAASRTPGFVSGGEANQKLALQMWDGAEYICRENELATIKNIFLSNFLQKLREVVPNTPVVSSPVGSAVANVPAAPVVASVAPAAPAAAAVETSPTPAPPPSIEPKPDLVVELDEDVEKARSYSDECVPEGETEFDSSEVDVIEPDEVSSPQDKEPDPMVPEEAKEESGSEIEETSSQPVQEVLASDTTSNYMADSAEPESVESIVIAEKEPYNFEACTVTAVVQLLPESESARKCVVSVRTHDFYPLVAIANVGTADTLSQITGALGRAFEQYRSELPARAADKMKKEKPAAKKTSKSAAKTSKPASAPAKASDAPAKTEAANSEQNQQGLFGA